MGKGKGIILSIVMGIIIFCIALALDVPIIVSVILAILSLFISYFIYEGEFFYTKSTAILIENLPVGIFRGNVISAELDTTNYDRKEKVSTKSKCSTNSEVVKTISNHELVKEQKTAEACEKREEVKQSEQVANMDTEVMQVEDTGIQVTAKDVQDNKSEIQSIQATDVNVQAVKIYWTPNGKSYHKTNKCRTLSRSKTICSGTIEESGKSACCDQCNN